MLRTGEREERKSELSTRFWEFGSGHLNPSPSDSQQLSFPFLRGRMCAGYGSFLIWKNRRADATRNVASMPGVGGQARSPTPHLLCMLVSSRARGLNSVSFSWSCLTSQ